MAEKLQELIAKIQQEGIKAAQDKADKILEDARKESIGIIAEAKDQARQLVTRSGQEIDKARESANASLEQAGRDLLISLREEIDTILNRLIKRAVAEALSPQELAGIITNLVKGFREKDDTSIEVLLSKGDLDKLDKGFLAQLKKETQKGITLKASEEVTGGLIISYDVQKSHYDFTDQALAEFIGRYLKPKLHDILGVSSS
ncbi:MAG: hypothetical protein PHG40_04435 [Candidatus Omnitrophica bacterium]|nr:hypothetical protein [Candidatus Omnitrophota bacterium]